MVTETFCMNVFLLEMIPIRIRYDMSVRPWFDTYFCVQGSKTCKAMEENPQEKGEEEGGEDQYYLISLAFQ